jgi:hypothetical protein
MAYVVFVSGPAGYELGEREGEPPAAGSEVEEDGRKFVVAKVGASPLPGDTRPCIYLEAA